MQPHVRVLRQVVRASLYAVDDRAVADAIVLRAMLRRTVPNASLQNMEGDAGTRSFRFQRDGRSFRLSSSSRHPHSRR
jgi:hypothetical protein